MLCLCHCDDRGSSSASVRSHQSRSSETLESASQACSVFLETILQEEANDIDFRQSGKLDSMINLPCVELASLPIDGLSGC